MSKFVVCPVCGQEGKRRIYRNKDKYAYERVEHWDPVALVGSQCHIPTMR